MYSHQRMPLRWLTVFVLPLLLIACKSKPKLVDVDPSFSKYIEAYTSGVISKKNTIRIKLAVDANVTHTLNETIKENLFAFSPSVEGKAYWVDARTIEFKPDKDLTPDQLYEASFNLGKVMHVPGAFKTFKFNVQVIKPSFNVEDFGLRSNNKTTMTLTGQVTTADVESSATVEKLLAATMNNTGLTINWQHNEANRIHNFTITNIQRSSAAGTLQLTWTGTPLGLDITGSKEVTVPAIGDFTVLNIRAVQDQEQYALIQFSDPLSNQSFNGLVTLSDQADVSYTVMGSELRVYASGKLDGNYTLTVHEGVENQWGDKLEKASTANIFFENRLPSVKIFGRGSILPNSGGRLVLPFEAINLKSVDVSIIKIYGNNVSQFLQRNDIDGNEDLRRVGRPIAQATVALDNDKTLNLHKSNHFSLDLDKYIKTEPGAIYRVTIGFRPQYSLYTCDSLINDRRDDGYSDDDNGNSPEGPDDEDDFWSRYDSYYTYGYNWDEKDNPCHTSYYNKDRYDSRNILASNIGLIAKRGNDKSLFVAATNILTTDALANVELDVLDYQQQIIATASTGSDGTAMLQLKRKPYLLVAKQGDERGYLKLDDGNSLALGRFDISGDEVKNGIKGFIFGERGVWRPGDSLYLSCVIDDIDNKLPKEHPVEMELVSPRGQLYKRLVQTNAFNGFNVFRTATDADAPTGNWLCRVKVGGATFEKRIKIETVMPNRLKINLDFGGLDALGENANTNGTLSAEWLFGAKAQNLKAKVEAQLYRKETSFDKFKDYVFDDPTSSFTPQSKTIFDGTLNGDGTAPINAAFETQDGAPGQLLANLSIKVFEPGGNFSIDNVAMPYNPYSSYVGVHVPPGDKTWGYLLSGSPQRFDIVNVNTKGALVQGTTTADVEVYKIQWRWWWDNDDDNTLSNFTQDKYNKLVRSQSVTLTNGRGSYTVTLPEEDWGRYLILVKDKNSGHTTGATFYVDDYSWQTRRDNSDPSAAAMLEFSSDKTTYNVGEQANLTIPTPKEGKALVSIESGTKVLKTEWIKTTQGQTKYSFAITKDMTPNVYVNVSLIQPHAQTLNDLPIRMYGVIPIMVQDKNTILKPVISMASEIRPEQKNTITVSEASGKDMTYVIAIVDDGLLDLTHFKTPNPHDAFFAREALGVKSWDIYDQVIGAWGAQLERILTIGGDAEAALAAKTRKANRFKPVVKFMGPFTLTGGSKTHTFELPPYMGSVRAMVVAAGNNAFGYAEKTVKVKKPVMVLATLPRVLGPGEQLKIPVTIFATNNSVKDVKLTMQSNPFIEAGGVQSIHFNAMGEQEVYFDATVKNNTGIGKVKVVASSGKESDVSEIEIDIRNPNQPITQVAEATLQPGQSWNNAVTMIGDGANAKAVLEVSSIPTIDLQKRLNYLITYPHGCVEQTTSAVFPQLVLNKLLDVNDEQKKQIDFNVRTGIQKLQNFQQTDGGFSYWPGYAGSNEWGSNYAGHFLLEASEYGYNVPSSMLQNWKQYERTKALAWNVTSAPWYGADLEQAYRLYLLALAKAPELGAMNRLKEWKFLTPEGKWRLAAAYYLAGQPQVAAQLTKGLPVTFPQRPNPGYTFGSDLRDEAMVLEALTIMNRQGEAEQLVRTVAAKLSQDNWYSTQTTAYCLVAIAEYSGNIKSDKKIQLTGNVSGKSVDISSGSSVSQTAIPWQGGKGSVQITNKGGNVLYVRVINSGQPFSNQTVPFVNNPNVLQVSVNYLNTDGNALDVAKIKQGADFVARVTVTNPGNRGSYSNMALSQIFPSGWEILNTRLYNTEGAFKSSPSDYMDIRDDRVYQYFDITGNETLTYYVQLNAAYLGKFYWPGVYCEAMYDNTISGGVSGKWIEVVQ
ncbi:MAG TPA: MG2 domain-containing protein [Chitinophagaceae bacterium]|nr:MG2 domain-containing protein [Chitinophagaceae bacterium]